MTGCETGGGGVGEPEDPVDGTVHGPREAESRDIEDHKHVPGQARRAEKVVNEHTRSVSSGSPRHGQRCHNGGGFLQASSPAVDRSRAENRRGRAPRVRNSSNQGTARRIAEVGIAIEGRGVEELLVED